MRAVWKNVTLAESDQTIVVEGNHYFSPESINREYFEESDTHTTCSWKGQASYYHITVSGQRNEDAAWYYPQPKEAAAEIKDHIAFWKGVEVAP
ncbi:DUF427 domain-containing protein [Acidobacteria bacterium AH-259-A15]|nr:DUF427 domain-containing protein [Acidobacteria bacterium AH-259-A15]